MKKGFIHIIEVIVIVLIGFLIVYQFSVLPSVHQQYDRVRLELLGKDLIYMLDAQGVQWLDRDDVRSQIETYLNGSSVSYSVNIQNAIRTPISVGCICSPAEFQAAQDALRPVVANGQHIQFVVTQLTPPSNAGCASFVTSLPLVFDTILFFDTNLTGDLSCQTYDYTTQLLGFLGAGKGVVQVRDLSRDHLQGAEGGMYKTFFGVTYAPSIGHLDGVVETAQPGTLGYTIRQYIHGIPFSEEDFEDDTANDWSPLGGNWRVINNDTKVYKGEAVGGGAVISTYTGVLPENYTIRFRGKMQLGSGVYWAFRFENSSSYTFAGIAPQFGLVVIGNETAGISSVIYNVTTADMKPGEWYDITITKRKDDVHIWVWNESGFVGEAEHTLPPLQAAPPGFLLVGQSPAEQVFIDNIRFFLPDPWTFQPFSEEVNASSGVVMHDEGGAAALVIQDGVPQAGNTGRSVWLSAGADHQEELLRAIVAWSAGSSYAIVPRTVPNPLTINLLRVVQDDFFQPITVQVSVGYSF